MLKTCAPSCGESRGCPSASAFASDMLYLPSNLIVPSLVPSHNNMHGPLSLFLSSIENQKNSRRKEHHEEQRLVYSLCPCDPDQMARVASSCASLMAQRSSPVVFFKHTILLFDPNFELTRSKF
jgi:hypothetical protein